MVVCALSAACAPLQPQGEVALGTAMQTAATTGSATGSAATTIPASVATPASDQTERSGGEYRHIGPSQLARMLEEKDFLLINTHAPYGFQIEQTDAHIPVDDEGRWLSHYPDDRTAKIVLYCRSGNWSTVAAEHLVAADYANIWHLDGGMVAWDAADLPLVFDQ